MKRKLYLISVLLQVTFIFACSCNGTADQSTNKGSDMTKALQTYVDQWLGSLGHPVMAADQVKAIIDDPNLAKNYQIVSVRKPEDYAKGHIKGAINLSWKTIASDTNLAKLDKNKKIITYCYSGHTGQIAMVALGLMGYDVTNIKYGMMGWTSEQNVLNYNAFDCNPPDYPTEK